MSRLTLALTLILTGAPLLAGTAPARPLGVTLTGEAVEAEARACRGPGGRLVQCPRHGPVF